MKAPTVDERACLRLKNERGVTNHLMQQGQKVRNAAIGLAPKLTGRYMSEIAVQRSRSRGGSTGASVFVVARNFKSHWIEWGTGQPGPTRAVHVLERATRSVIKRFKAAPKGTS